MLKKCLILTVSLLTLQSITYAAERDTKEDPSSTLPTTQQTTVIPDESSDAASEQPKTDTLVAETNPVVVVPSLATDTQPKKSRFSNLFCCVSSKD